MKRFLLIGRSDVTAGRVSGSHLLIPKSAKPVSEFTKTGVSDPGFRCFGREKARVRILLVSDGE